MLLICEIILLAVSFPTSFGLDYLAYGPKSLHENSVVPVSVLCSNATSDVNVTVTLTGSDKKTFFSEVTGTAKAGQVSTLLLPVLGLSDYDWLTLTVKGQDSTDFFESRTDVQKGAVKTRNLHVFIQTDQPLYQAKDVVRFRIITVDSQLLPVYLPLNVRVKDPQGNVVKQYLNSTDDSVAGYFSGDLALSSDPLLGAWTIAVESSNAVVSGRKTFLVDEYVLPRFDVKISTPSYITRDSKDFRIVVDSNYTFGGAVRGKLNLTLLVTYGDPVYGEYGGYGSPSIGGTKNATILKYVDLEFNGRLERVMGINSALPDFKSIKVLADITETLTGASKSTTADISIKKNPYKLEIVTSETETFLPGYNFTFRAKVTDLDGRPIELSSKTLKLVTQFYDQLGYSRKPLQSKKKIIALPGAESVTEDLFTDKTPAKVPVQYVPIPINEYHEMHPDSSVYFIPDPDTTADVNVTDVNQEATDYPWMEQMKRQNELYHPAGKSYEIPSNGSVAITVSVPAAARLISFSVKFGGEQKTLTVKGRESPSGSFVQINALSSSLQFGDTARFSLEFTTRSEERLHLTISSSTNASYSWETSSDASGRNVELSVPILVEMGLTGRLVVYYVRADKEIVAGQIPLTVSNRGNDVKLSVTAPGAQSYVKPGEGAAVRVQTSPNSFVGLLAMDESLLLLKKPTNDIAETDISSFIAKGKNSSADLFSVDDYFKVFPTYGNLTARQPTSRLGMWNKNFRCC